MKRILIAIIIICFSTSLSAQPLSDSVWRRDVKSVLLTRDGVDLESPVLTLGGGDRLLLQFDVLADEVQLLRYSVAHCDAQWRRDDLEAYEFMSGFESGDIENYDYSFTTLRSYVHYHQMIPSPYSTLLHSGNYVVAVTDEGGDTLFTRRFWVSEDAASMAATVDRPYDGSEMLRRQEVDVRIATPQGCVVCPTLRPEYVRILAQQNGREDTQRWLVHSGYEGPWLCYRHRKENIFDGGNNYRYFDMSNLHTPMYNVQRVEEYGGEIFALLRPDEDRSRRNYVVEESLNGGMKINVWDRNNAAVEAEYVWVNISLPMAQPILDGRVYVVGALTDWKLDSTSYMEYNTEYRAYTKRLLLKQGYYSYQLLVDKGHGISRTARLEGDHWETPNSYTLFLYYRSPSDRADRLLKVTKVRR